MKRFRVLSVLLLVAIVFSLMTAPSSASASSRSKSKSKKTYAIVIDRSDHMFYVFVKKSKNSSWSLLGKAQCATGNPFWETPTGTYTIWKKARSYKIDGVKCKYVLAFGKCPSLTICAIPNMKDDLGGDYYRLGNSCTMGQVWLSSYRARLLYNNIPIGTKVYIY